MKVVFLSTNDQLGGAAIVTLRLVEALRSAGVDARMVVGRKDGTDDYVAQVGQTRRKVAKVLERGEVFINNGFDMGDLWKVSTGSFGADVCGHPWVRDADVIVLGWINQGFLSLPQLKNFVTPGNRCSGGCTTFGAPPAYATCRRAVAPGSRLVAGYAHCCIGRKARATFRTGYGSGKCTLSAKALSVS